MKKQVIKDGDLHADLWESLNIFGRHIEGFEDVTVGEHPKLGLCIVNDDSRRIGFEWWVERPFDLVPKSLV